MKSVDKMIPWLRKNIRDFEYSESTIEIDLKFIVFESELLLELYPIFH